jgi:hypothetical protein
VRFDLVSIAVVTACVFLVIFIGDGLGWWSV